MRVSIVGAGYVGLVTGAGLADLGHEVICVDLDELRVAQIAAGVPGMYEPGLEELLARNAGNRLSATTDLRAAVLGSELTLVAVGTPSGADGIDLSHVVRAAGDIGAVLAEKDTYHVVVVKSTVVPGTTDGEVRRALEEASGKTCGPEFGLGMNPEFLTEGQAVADFLSPDRIVLGALDARTLGALEQLYAPFSADVPRLRTTTRTAEMTKYAANALLATMISFSNEIANLCAAVGGVDVVEVMEGVHLSRYLSPPGHDGRPVRASLASFLEAGCGFGGSCLPKDVAALIAHGERHGKPMRVLRAVLDTNRTQPDEVLRLLEAGIGDLAGARVTVLGLAFKPDTDDVRESPALPILERLVARGAAVAAYDPVVQVVPGELDGRVELRSDLRAALEGADAVVVVTRWKQFSDLPALMQELDEPPLLLDGRRMLSKDSVERYAGIGLGG